MGVEPQVHKVRESAATASERIMTPRYYSSNPLTSHPTQPGEAVPVAQRCYSVGMSTTTLRISPPLRARLAAAAKTTGVSAHALILDALERRIEELEVDAEFHALADQRWAAFLKSGKSVSWEDGKSYLEALARGEKPKKPRARKLGR